MIKILLSKCKEYIIPAMFSVIYSVIVIVVVFAPYGGFNKFFNLSIVCVVSLIASYIFKLIFKEKAAKLLKSSAWISLLIGVVISIGFILFWFTTVPYRYIDDNNLGEVLSIFIFLPWLMLPFMIAAMGFVGAFLTFLILRLNAWKPQITVCIAIITLILGIMPKAQVTLAPINEQLFKDVFHLSAYPEFEFGTQLGSKNQIRSSGKQWFFIHDDKFYAYIKNNKDYEQDEFFYTDLNGKNKQTIAVNEEIRIPDFHFVLNDEAYFYSYYTDELGKINLKSGEIQDVDKTTFENLYKQSQESNLTVEFPNKEEYINLFNPGTLLVKSKNNSAEKTINDVIYFRLENDTVYVIKATKIRDDIWSEDNLKDIHIEKLLL